MKMPVVISTVAMALGLMSGGAAAAADGFLVLAKPGGTLVMRKADEAACEIQGRATRNTTYAEGPNNGLMLKAISDGSIVSDAIKACLGQRGWAEIALTAEETGQYSSVSGPARDQWLETFFGGEIGARVQAALPVPFTPLPSAIEGKAFVGGLALDPDKLEPVVGPVGPKGVLLRGVATYQATATLTRSVDAPMGLGRVRVAEGASFHQVMLSSRSGPRAAWCGQALNKGMYCFLNHVQSYDITVGWGRSWLFGLTATAPDVELDTIRTVAPINLKLDEPGRYGPIEYVLRIAALNNKQIRLEAAALHADEQVVFWRGRLSFDAAGTAILPFWTKKLVLTHSGGAVQVRVEDTNSVLGWPTWQP